jgi:hypothetical protein
VRWGERGKIGGRGGGVSNSSRQGRKTHMWSERSERKVAMGSTPSLPECHICSLHPPPVTHSKKSLYVCG